ncbi:hypothetical protein C8R45DRAFT_1091248 [Mycena sanguinolenta]|nr:hypothetical protein C8R45DRAFT_1091248 [Mycena sanguinolenta]
MYSLYICRHTASNPRSSSLSILNRRAVFETAVVTTPAPQSHPLLYTSAAQQHFSDQRRPTSAICICLPLRFSAHLWLARNPRFSSFARTPAHTDVRTLAKARCTLSGRMLALLASRRDANHPERRRRRRLGSTLIAHRWPMFAAMLFGIITGIMPRSSRRTNHNPSVWSVFHLPHVSFVSFILPLLSYGCFQSCTALRVSTLCMNPIGFFAPFAQPVSSFVDVGYCFCSYV